MSASCWRISPPSRTTYSSNWTGCGRWWCRPTSLTTSRRPNRWSRRITTYSREWRRRPSRCWRRRDGRYWSAYRTATASSQADRQVSGYGVNVRDPRSSVVRQAGDFNVPEVTHEDLAECLPGIPQPAGHQPSACRHIIIGIVLSFYMSMAPQSASSHHITKCLYT